MLVPYTGSVAAASRAAAPWIIWIIVSERLMPNLHRLLALAPALILPLMLPSAALAEEHHAGSMGAELPLWTVLPFVGLLLCIAILPLTAGHWWEHNKSKALVVVPLSLAFAAYLVVVWGEQGVHQLVEKGMEYISFLLLLGALFVISGGIYIRGSLSGTPLLNTAIMGLGGLLASFIGTTGASMVLIRPLLRANATRVRRAHVVVFFIFVVSNCGGLLTPLGDPPLFLGFLKGVPFEWTMRLWKEWALVNGLLLAIFNIWDQRVLAKEELARPGSQLEEVQQHEPLAVEGAHNFLFLAGIVAVIYSAGRGFGNGGNPWPFGVQEGLMLLLALASYFSTAKTIHAGNRFGFTPIIEVAILFAGIFVTMIPALLILNANGAKLGLSEPWHYFWATGILSSFLDNAPTYLTFAAAAAGTANVATEGQYLREFLSLPSQGAFAPDQILAAISCGAVFMGANTYIGNGPNFMVKAIAEENGVKMPSFFGYMAYSCGILIPILIVVTLVFFR
jgi:Na+/H+ antiporter NhaD/arsenite permease-like protein